MTPQTHTRRRFLRTGAALLSTAAIRPKLRASSAGSVDFGMLADVHHNRMPDAHSRLESFLTAAGKRDLDFLIQLGDFCDGYSSILTSAQKQFVADWHRVRIPHYSVLGNHE